jgi:DNA-directed RNA polymerase beta subunit
MISVKVDRKRKLPVTLLLRAIGYGTDDEISASFSRTSTPMWITPTSNPLERRTTSND